MPTKLIRPAFLPEFSPDVAVKRHQRGDIVCRPVVNAIGIHCELDDAVRSTLFLQEGMQGDVVRCIGGGHPIFQTLKGIVFRNEGGNIAPRHRLPLILRKGIPG